jgi:hypothetical protein
MALSALAPTEFDRSQEEPLMGLAPLARMAFAGADLAPMKARLLERIARNENDANALLDLSIVLQLMGQRELGLSMQALALEIRPFYRLRPSTDSARIRLLAILTPGDLTENNSLEFLTEGSDIELILLYVAPHLPLPATLPEHDLAMVAVCETDRNRPLLQHLQTLAASWPRRVLCLPDRIARLSRDGACALLQSMPGVVMPAAARIDRRGLERIGRREAAIAEWLQDGAFPVIARPVDSQKGAGWPNWTIRMRFSTIWKSGPRRHSTPPLTWNIADRMASSANIASC